MLPSFSVAPYAPYPAPMGSRTALSAAVAAVSTAIVDGLGYAMAGGGGGVMVDGRGE